MVQITSMSKRLLLLVIELGMYNTWPTPKWVVLPFGGQAWSWPGSHEVCSEMHISFELSAVAAGTASLGSCFMMGL